MINHRVEVRVDGVLHREIKTILMMKMESGQSRVTRDVEASKMMKWIPCMT